MVLALIAAIAGIATMLFGGGGVIVGTIHEARRAVTVGFLFFFAGCVICLTVMAIPVEWWAAL